MVLKVIFVLHATTTGDRQSDEFDTNLRALKTFQIEILPPLLHSRAAQNFWCLIPQTGNWPGKM